MPRSRPTVARDTRLLLAIVAISVALLWVLARIRFPDRGETPNPVQPVLAQLAPPSAFDDMSATVAQVESRVQSSIMAVDLRRAPAGRGAAATHGRVLALRFRDDLSVALIGADSDAEAADSTLIEALEVARDRASHLVVIRAPGSVAPALSTWSPRRPQRPRFLIAAAASARGVNFRPVFVGSLGELVSPIWSGSIWSLPATAGLAAGTLVFTADGAWAGLTVAHDGQVALVSADTVIDRAGRLARLGQTRPGRLGIDVQPLSPALAAGTGADAGVVVTWVDPQGPAAGQLAATDVVDQIDGSVVTSLEHWRARVARLTEGEAVLLRSRRGDEVREARITAAAPAVAGAGAGPIDKRPLGLGLRTIPRLGAAIIRIDRDSAAWDAGLQLGDVLTVVAGFEAPTSAQALRAFTAASPGRPVVIGFARADAHHVLALERTW
ncbi:MAG: PDZ domain-containing protein [Acidobacteriota bacterium]